MDYLVVQTNTYNLMIMQCWINLIVDLLMFYQFLNDMAVNLIKQSNTPNTIPIYGIYINMQSG